MGLNPLLFFSLLQLYLRALPFVFINENLYFFQQKQPFFLSDFPFVPHCYFQSFLLSLIYNLSVNLNTMIVFNCIYLILYTKVSWMEQHRDRRLHLLSKWRKKGGVLLIGYSSFRNIAFGKHVKDKNTAREMSYALQVIFFSFSLHLFCFLLTLQVVTRWSSLKQ